MSFPRRFAENGIIAEIYENANETGTYDMGEIKQ